MPSIQDDRGFNQGYRPSLSVEVRTGRRSAYIISRMGPQARGRMLEIGCGTGRMSYLLAKNTGMQVLGADICAPFIEQAGKTYSLPNLRYGLLDFSKPGDIKRASEGGLFDCVAGDGILHHLYPVLGSVLAGIHGLLKEKGRIVFLEPNFFNPYCLLIFNIKFLRKLARLEPGEMTFTKKFITGKLEKAGFTDIRVEYRDFLVPGVPDFLIGPVTAAGGVLEKIPAINMLAQSMFISASKK